jgi:hypothetical protein
MDLKTRLESHPVATLKKEISKTNVKGYSKMKKNEVVSLMLKHSDRFNHIKHSKSEEFKKEKIKEIMSKNDKSNNQKPEVKSKGDFEKLKVKGKEYFYNKKNQKLYDIDTKKQVGKIEKGQVVLEAKKEEIHPDGIHIHIDWKDGEKELKKFKTAKQGETAFKKIKEKRDYKQMKLMDGKKILDYSA